MQNPEPTDKNRHILVVVDCHPAADRLLRIARRKARDLDASWEVLVIETPYSERQMDADDNEQLLSTLTLARQMGGLVTNFPAHSMKDGIFAFLEQRRKESIIFDAIIIGERIKRPLFSRLWKACSEELKQKLGDKIEVVVVQLEESVNSRRKLVKLLKTSGKEIIFSMLAIILVTFVIETINYLMPGIVTDQHRNKVVIYMVACTFVAIRYGIVPSIFAALSSYIFLSVANPLYGSYVYDAPNQSNLSLFLISSVVIAIFANQEHRLRWNVADRAERFQSLLTLHRATLNKHDILDAIKTLDSELSKFLEMTVVFFLPSASNPDRLEPVFHNDLVLAETDQKAMNLCRVESKATGTGTPLGQDCSWRFEPMVTSEKDIGVLGIQIADKSILDITFDRLFDSIAEQVALILERLELRKISEEANIQTAREKLRSMLLSSVSHDLKTPLASVIGSLSVYRSMEKTLSEDQRHTLINTALEEAQRLDSFITNILDMTRLETGQIGMKQDWVRPGKFVREIQRHLKERLRNHPITIIENTEEIEVNIDPTMTRQVLQNVLDNAAKYTPPGTKIEIEWGLSNDLFILRIRDFGPGIAYGHQEKIFDKYARIERKDSKVAGTGLGLAISKSIMHAQGGDIVVANHDKGGAEFILTLPMWRRIDKKKIAAA